MVRKQYINTLANSPLPKSLFDKEHKPPLQPRDISEYEDAVLRGFKGSEKYFKSYKGEEIKEIEATEVKDDKGASGATMLVVQTMLSEELKKLGDQMFTGEFSKLRDQVQTVNNSINAKANTYDLEAEKELSNKRLNATNEKIDKKVIQITEKIDGVKGAIVDDYSSKLDTLNTNLTNIRNETKNELKTKSDNEHKHHLEDIIGLQKELKSLSVTIEEKVTFEEVKEAVDNVYTKDETYSKREINDKIKAVKSKGGTSVVSLGKDLIDDLNTSLSTTWSSTKIQAELDAIDSSVTLADLSANSTTTPNSLYQMTSTIPVEFRTSGGSTLLYLDETNGIVGVGTVTPRGKFDVSGVNSAAYFGGVGGQVGTIGNTRRLNYGDILFGRNLQGVSGADTYSTSETSSAGYGGIEFRFAGETRFYGASGSTTAGAVVTPTANVTILNSGNVGIGTTAPLSNLHVYGGAGGGSTPTAGTDLLTIENSSTAHINIVTPTNASGGIYFSDNTRGRGSVTYNHNTDVLQFGRGGTGNEMVLSATGLGIGQTTPAYKLDVLGSGTAAASIGMKVVGGTSAAAGGLKLGAYNATYGGFWSAAVTPSTSNYALIADSNVTALNATSGVYLYNNNNARVLVNSTGMLVSNSLTGTPDRAFHAEVFDAVTNAVTFSQRYTHITSGTATTGFGVGEEYELENASGTNRIASTQEVSRTTATNAIESAQRQLKLMRAGTLTTALTLSSLGALTITDSFTSSGTIQCGSSNAYRIGSRSAILSAADGTMYLTNNALNDFDRLQLGGTTSAFPSIQRSGTGLVARLADDSADTDITAAKVISTAVVRLKGYVVSELPEGVIGDTCYVTDATEPVWGTDVSGGGSVVVPVFYNGEKRIVA